MGAPDSLEQGKPFRRVCQKMNLRLGIIQLIAHRNDLCAGSSLISAFNLVQPLHLRLGNTHSAPPEQLPDLPLQNAKTEGSRDGGQTHSYNQYVAPATA